MEDAQYIYNDESFRHYIFIFRSNFKVLLMDDAISIYIVMKLPSLLEFDSSAFPRMMLKIDIEKTFDTAEWIAIFATLWKISFPELWISLMHASFLLLYS